MEELLRPAALLTGPFPAVISEHFIGKRRSFLARLNLPAFSKLK